MLPPDGEEAVVVANEERGPREVDPNGWGA